MHRGIVTLLALVATGVAAGSVSAAKPGSGELTVAASKAQVTFSRTAVVSGQLKQAPVAGQQVTLEQSPFPFGKFDAVANATTDATGNYSFTVTPAVSTRYRVTKAVKPKLTSAETQVNVAILVTRRVGDATPARGQRVRFSGTTGPALAGRPVAIERRAADRTWKVVATTTLNAQSKYAKRVRIRRSGYYRATVAGTDAALLTGHSRRIRLRVH
jgi:hypothetical protein